MKLNGWQRLGVVAFVIWAIFGSLWAWVDTVRTVNAVYGTQLEFCYAERADSAEREVCRARAQSITDEEMAKANSTLWWGIPLIIFIPSLIVWGLISLAIVTVRWVRHGFATRNRAATKG